MIVLFVASGNKTGKPGVVVQNQANSLRDAGIKTDFFLIKGKKFIGYIKNIFPLWKYIKAHPIRIIHSHYSHSAIVASMALLFLPSRPHIVSLMGSDIQLRGIPKYLAKFLNRFCWTKTIVKSKQMMIDSGISNALVIPNGVDIKKIEKLEKNYTFENNNSTLNTHSKTVLFAANPSRKEKNYSLAKLAMKSVDARLKIVYDKPHTEILNELLKADVLLLTSFWEGSPNIIKEAMACNCPIVSTNIGDVEWLFGNEPGHFLTSFEPEDVSAKIELALKFALNYTRTNGRMRILELGLDAENIARRLTSVYEEVLR